MDCHCGITMYVERCGFALTWNNARERRSDGKAWRCDAAQIVALVGPNLRISLQENPIASIVLGGSIR
jgi:hypothetical protein